MWHRLSIPVNQKCVRLRSKANQWSIELILMFISLRIESPLLWLHSQELTGTMLINYVNKKSSYKLASTIILPRSVFYASSGLFYQNNTQCWSQFFLHLIGERSVATIIKDKQFMEQGGRKVNQQQFYFSKLVLKISIYYIQSLLFFL